MRLPSIAEKLRSKEQKQQKEYLSILFNTLDVARQHNKSQEDYLAIVSCLNDIDNLKNYSDPNGKLDIWYYWVKGRYLVSIGENKKANAQYKKAFHEAIYRVGKFQKALIEEALSVAAVQGKNGDQGFLKQVKSMGIILGVSLPNASADRGYTSYSAKDIVDEYEVACLRHQFVKLFPDACSAMKGGEINESRFGALWFSSKELNRKPNLNRLDENVTLKGSNGRIKKLPQLAYFAMFNKNDEVAGYRRIFYSGQYPDEIPFAYQARLKSLNLNQHKIVVNINVYRITNHEQAHLQVCYCIKEIARSELISLYAV